jgi:hypothetical protein
LPAIQPLDSLPVLAFFALFAIATLAFYEGGFRIGRWAQDRTPDLEEEGPTGMLVGSIVALLAFLLAITTGMASDRYDTRRVNVLDEANAIKTAYLRAGYLPEPASSDVRALLKAYVPLRITGSDPVAVQAAIVESERLHGQMWAIAEEAARQDSSDVTALFVEAVNDVITIHETRVIGGVYARVPPTVLWILVAGAALSLGMVGYSAGLSKKRSPVSAIALVIALGAVLTLAVDLDRPRDGFVQVSQQPLIDLERQLNEVP